MKRLTLYFLSLLYLLNIGFIKSYAADSSANATKDFAYEVVFPENQKRQDVGYYDLAMKAGTTQTIQLKLYNLSSENMNVTIAINSAKTNGNGIIEYGESHLEPDDSLRYDISKQVTGPQEVTLAPQSNKVVEFTISLPKESFEGYLAGGIQLKPVNANEKASKGQAVVLNEFAYVIGLLISESDTNQLKPNIELNGMSLKLRDGRYVLNTNLSNTQPIFIEDMTTHVKVRKKGTKSILFEKKTKDMRMAPNTMLNYPVELENTTIDSGDYIVEVNMTTKNGGKWNWEKEFTFSRLEAKQIKEMNSSTKKSNIKIWVVIITVILVLISSCIYALRKMFFSKK